ncbi:MAG: hypothetical protein ACLFUR_04150 [Candidatus Hadarchaeia archaeon]
MDEKVFGLISGGIDSPLAVLLISEGFQVIPLHFCLYPMSSEESAKKGFQSLKELNDLMCFSEVIIFPWARILTEIRSNIEEKYACVACRSAMLETASRLRNLYGVSGIVTGESLGQKASQTLDNLVAISTRLDIPIIRPLIGMNKDEIKKISKERGIWRANHAGCCLATPSKPRTKATRNEIDRKMNNIDLDSLIEESMDFILEVDDFDIKYEDYLFRLAGEFG